MRFHGTPGTHSGSAIGDGTLKNQSNKMGMTQDTFTSSLHLVQFCQLCLVFVVGSELVVLGVLVHVDMHGGLVVLWVAVT